MFTSFILVQYTFMQSFWWDFMWTASDITRRQNPTFDCLIIWLLKSFHLLFCNFSWVLSTQCFVDVSVGTTVLASFIMSYLKWENSNWENTSVKSSYKALLIIDWRGRVQPILGYPWPGGPEFHKNMFSKPWEPS